MKLIIHLLKSTSHQPELFPLQFLKIIDFIYTIGRSLYMTIYIFKEKQANFNP